MPKEFKVLKVLKVLLALEVEQVLKEFRVVKVL